MRKLILLLAAASVTLTGCLKDNNQGSVFDPVRPGMYIYQAGTNQNRLAMLNAEIGIRLGMLLAEAELQGKMESLNTIQVKDIGNAVNYLFGTAPRVELKKTDDGYQIVYQNARGIKDDYIRLGTYTILTNGAAQLSDATPENPWQITFTPNPGSDEASVMQLDTNNQLYFDGGITEIYAVDGNGYKIELSNIVCYYQSKLKSDWSGSYTWTPSGGNLTLSANQGKSSSYSGEGAGQTFNTFNNATPASMSFRIENGEMLGYQWIGSGSEIVRLTSILDYSPELYPSPEVKVTWSEKGQAFTIYYNGQVVSSN